MLYPLFVHNIGSMLCHPNNQSGRATQAMAAVAQRKQQEMRSGQPVPGLPSLQQQHHHALALPGPHAQLSSHPSMGRPTLDRNNSFPTPPTSASTVMGSMGGSENFQWGQQGMANGHGPSQISIDTSLTNNGRSLPNTPATTPPGSNIQQNMHAYPPVSQSYDASRQMYQPSAPAPSSYPPPNPSPQERPMYAHTSYVKSEMGPPSNRTAGPNGEHVDSKPANGIMHAGQGEAAAVAEEEADHEHDGEYTHDSGAYDTSRGSYNYTAAPPAASLHNDHSHLSPDMQGSPHQAGSGRATPRTAAAPQSYYAPQGYNTPPRVGQTSSNLYSVMSNERASTNGASANDVYASQGDMSGSMQNGYQSQAPALNGVKRGRDDDDDRGEMKRRKGIVDGATSMPSPTFNNQLAPSTGAVQRRSR
jgi:protein SOK2